MELSKNVIDFSLALTFKTKELFFFNKLNDNDIGLLNNPLFFNKLEPRFIEFVNKHRLQNKLPSKIYKEINNAANIRNLHTLSIFNNLTEVLKKFNEEKINYCLLKGAYLNNKDYYSHSKRPVKDVDIIIEKTDLLKALDLCLVNGYSFKEKGLNNKKLEFSFQYRYDLPNLINSSNQILELHYRFSDPFDHDECIFLDQVFKNKVKKELFGAEAYYPSPMNQILMSIYSGTQKCYFDSGTLFLYDLHQIQKEYGIKDQDIFIESKKIGIHHCAEIAIGIKNSFLLNEENIPESAKKAKRLVVYNRVSESKRFTNLNINKNIIQILQTLYKHSFSSQSVSASMPYKSGLLKLKSLPKKIYYQIKRVTSLFFLFLFSSATKKELLVIKELFGDVNEK